MAAARANRASLESASRDIHWLVELEGRPAGAASGSASARVQRFLELRERLNKEGHLAIASLGVDLDRTVRGLAALIVALGIFAVAPFYSYDRDYTWEEDRRFKAFPIVHSEEGGSHLVQEVFTLSVLVVEGAAATYFLDGWIRNGLLLVLALGLCFEVYKMLRIIAWQEKWKASWKGLLIEGLTQATVKNDQNLYDRTFDLYRAVKAEPALPLARLQRLVVLTFGITQFLIVPIGQTELPRVIN